MADPSFQEMAQQILDAHGWTHQQLADECRCSRANIGYIVNGREGAPGWDVANAIVRLWRERPALTKAERMARAGL